jgi:hypothetical protein
VCVCVYIYMNIVILEIVFDIESRSVVCLSTLTAQQI